MGQQTTSKHDRRARRELVGVAALAMMSLPSRAQAQNTPACEALESAGMQANQSGDHAAAYAQFERSYTQCHGARARGRMAIALMAMGRWSEADALMGAVLETRGDAWVEANRESLAQQRTVISAHIGELVVTSNGDGG